MSRGNMTSVKEIVVEIQMEEGEPLGATPNDKLIITKVQNGTISEGKLQVGDNILCINDVKIKDTNHFFQLLRYAPPVARILVCRDHKKAEELAARVHIPADRERNIMRRDGFLYELIRIAWKSGGPKLGLGIKHFQNRVLVSNLEQNSIAAEFMKMGDHIVDIDGQPVTDKDVARCILVKALQQRGEATMVIERPDTMETKQWVLKALSTQAAQPPSVALNSDVREIAQAERAKLAAKAAVKPKGLMAVQRKSNAVLICDSTISHIISSDNEGKNLRAVKK